MIRALYSAASGMKAQELNLDNIANNLANANTVGYKMRRAQFQDLMYQSVLAPGTASGQQTLVPTGLQLGLGTHASSNEIIFTEGSFTETGNPLDVVIQGNGFFQVLQPSGELAYTRAGQFQFDKDGNVVTSSGMALQPQITIPPDAQAVTIAPDGTVSYTLPNQTAAQQAGQIQLANFQNPAGLNSLGNNLYTPTDASGDAVGRRARRSARHGGVAAGVHRAVQRLGSGRVHRHDSDAARLRGQFQSGHRGRQHVPGSQ
jgi:flagellar basal-body rod protein FlgG